MLSGLGEGKGATGAGAAGRDGAAGSGASLELLIDRMKTFKSNDEFLAEIAKGT